MYSKQSSPLRSSLYEVTTQSALILRNHKIGKYSRVQQRNDDGLQLLQHVGVVLYRLQRHTEVIRDKYTP